ncbi:ABC transporter ATP-binding protein [Sedimentitalea nanhaiensis]|uniref:Peptide/nickel transport system ATP-binding protein n=1 Tax=Sedimentitalea nanhaiensis TaxID=999627 RepID=A0A1I7C4H9_9RHOB|nr:ABC transporter ATP-binding protein [Sedimentitalea nanhaiensis]SFT94325.1 peptide/nickel transport system ATP-binding protein [Sedimentitalea nanhaiensis]
MTLAQDISPPPPAAGENTILTVDNLCISVRTEQGLMPLVENLSFNLSKGETLAIAGESGSGKSLTSLAIMGLLPPPAVRVTGGSIRFDDLVLTGMPEHRLQQLRGNRIAMIFQEPMTALNPVMRIGAQLVEAIRAHENISVSQARKRALEAVRAVRLTEPERRLRQYPHELSGGMRQRVVIAMAIALRPDILIADEPTTALDVTVQREVLDLLRDLARDMDTALILITHDMGVVAEMADHVLVMQDGRMVERAPVRKLFCTPEQPYTRKLLAAVPRMGTGHGVHPDSQNEPLVSFRDTRVAYDLHGGILGRVVQRVHAVEGVSFDIYPGETFALVGESGCGKSTIARALTGLVPHTGNIRFKGQPLGNNAIQRKKISRELQMVFQDPMAALNGRMTAGDLVREPLVIHGIGTAASRRDRAAALFARVGLGEDALDRYPHEFSGGQRQRICIARALALEPQLIIADESVSALDVSVQATVLDLLAELKREMNMAYLFISHDMAVVENIADRVAVMYLGQIVELGTGSQIFGDPRHPYTRRLIEAVPHADPDRALPARVIDATDPPSPVRAVGDPPQVVVHDDVGDGHLVARL